MERNPLIHGNLPIGKTPFALAVFCEELEKPSRQVDFLVDACFHGEAAPLKFIPLYTTMENVAKGLYRDPSRWSTSGARAFLDCDGTIFEGGGKFLAASLCAAALYAFDHAADLPVYSRRFFP